MDTLVASRKAGVVIGAAYPSAVPSTFATWSTTVITPSPMSSATPTAASICPCQATWLGPTVTVEAQGLTSIDDFTFVGQGDTVLAAQNFANAVALVNPDGTHQTVLTAGDGLSNPTSLAARGRTVYVASGAYFTHNDPNLLLASYR